MQKKSLRYLWTVAISIFILLIYRRCQYSFRALSLPQEIDSKGLNASNFITIYSIAEDQKSNRGKCYLKMSEPLIWIYDLLSADIKLVRFSPPAGVSFQKQAISTIKGAMSTVPCQYGIVEFLVTDNKGKSKSDKFDLRKIKFNSTKISANKSKDIAIKLLDIAYPKNTDLKLEITANNKTIYNTRVQTNSEQYQSEVNNKHLSPDYLESLQKKDLPYLDSNTQILIIPAHTLSKFQLETATISLKANIRLFQNIPEHREPMEYFRYEYTVAPATIEFR